MYTPARDVSRIDWPEPNKAGAHRVRVTFFRDPMARRKSEHECSLAALALRVQMVTAPTKAELPWLKLARFGDLRTDRGSLRHGANILAITGIEADYDGEQMSFDQAVLLVERAGILALLYISPSYTEGKPRWRVLCSTSQELPPGDREKLVARLNGMLGGILAPESFTLPQAYYYGAPADRPAPRVEYIDGRPIDLLDHLDGGAIGRGGSVAHDGGAARNVTPIRPDVALPGAPPTIAAGRASAITAAAQANLDRGFFDRLPPARQIAFLRVFLEHIRPKADAPRSEWLPIVWAVTALTNSSAEGRALVLAWSKTSRRFISEADFDRDWRSYCRKPNSIGAGTLFHVAQEYGFDLEPWRDEARGAVMPAPNDGAISAIPARLPPAAALSEMNSRFTYCLDWGGEPMVAHRRPDDGHRAIAEEHLKRMLANRRVSGEDGKLVPLVPWWLTHPERAEVDQVRFEPEGGSDPAHTLNLWSGFTVKPARGSWRLLARHLYQMVCSRDRACWKYLLRWLAHAVQHPGTAPGTVIVLRSDSEGAGKSVLLEIMRRIFGQHARLLYTPEELTGTFNEHLEHVCFIGLNEPSFPGDHRAAAKLKSMITESQWLINGKFRAARQVPNIAHIMMTTNRPWAIPAGNKARRFLMLDVNEERADDPRYFEPLWHEIDNGGLEAFFAALLRVKVSAANLRAVPRTAALRRQQLRTASTLVRWAADGAASGILIPALSAYPNPPPDGGFGCRLPGAQLYASYRQWCADMRERAESNVEFGRWLAKCGVSQTRGGNARSYDVPEANAFAAAALRQAGIIQ